MSGSPTLQVIEGGFKLPRDLELASTSIRPDREPGAHIYTARFGGMSSGPTVTIRTVEPDAQSGAQMAITNMTVLPHEWCRNGYGSRVLQMLIKGAQARNISHIQAVQVQRDAEFFWLKNGFVPLGTICNDYRYEPKTPA